MKFRRLVPAALVPLAALALAAVPEGAVDGSCRPVEGGPAGAEICTIQTYLQCTGDLPLEHPQVEPVAVLDYPEPPGSVTGGNGCGRIDEPYFGSTTMNSLYEFNIGGYISGNMDTATVDLYLLGPGIGHAGETIHIDVRLGIDGGGAFGTENGASVTGDAFSLYNRFTIPVTPVLTNDGVTTKLTFTVVGLQEYLGLAAEPGTGADTERFIEMTVNFPHQGTCQNPPPNGTERCVPAGLYGWVYGNTEVPAGVTFNAGPDAELGTIVKAGEEATVVEG